jgi:tRNA (guanosine-2'-O-)-methyltransferase
MTEIEFLSQFVTDRRLALFLDRLQYRTRYVTVVLEDIFQSHNASAVLRTCDCFGIQNVHFLEKTNTYAINDQVALGASQWLTIQRYSGAHDDSPGQAIPSLREKGYRIVATTPHGDDQALEEFDPSTGPFALVFGTELNGLSEEVIQKADVHLKIPMFGFTESLNISVSAGVILHHLIWRLHQSGLNIFLNEEEKEEILLTWLRNSIKRSDLIENYYQQKPDRR